MENQKNLASLLNQCFGYYKYKASVADCKIVLARTPFYLESWEGIKELIRHRKMEKGVPLHLIHYDANLPLYENSDEEAYKWLDLWVRNVETHNEADIVDY